MFNLQKRINRRMYAIGVITSSGIFIALFLLLFGVSQLLGGDTIARITLILLIISYLAIWVFIVFLVRQRCNDVSGQHAVLLTVILVVTGLNIVLMFIPGEKTSNRYGKPPQGAALL